MTSWLQGHSRALVVFAAVALLVAGGLGWATHAAMKLEAEQWQSQAKADLDGRLRLAMWRLHSRLAPALAREDSRPYGQYQSLSPPPLLLTKDGKPINSGAVVEPTPLLYADLPDWMLLHFQVDAQGCWSSPQVLSDALRKQLTGKAASEAIANATDKRAELLAALIRKMPATATLLADARRLGSDSISQDSAWILNSPSGVGNPVVTTTNSTANVQGLSTQNNDYANRISQQARVQQELTLNQADLNSQGKPGRQPSRGPAPTPTLPGEPMQVELGAFVPIWLSVNTEPYLARLRLVHRPDKDLAQGVLLDVPRLQSLLKGEIEDLFPEGRVRPIHENDEVDSDRVMTALPLFLDPGPNAFPAAPRWTALRLGLVLAWLATLAALAAVGLGGWSLLNLSERRIRFVSAVTHELRTPLTTLRLYLDMLTGGMIKDESQKQEYLHTLNAEADRLNRLVANVLDFSRLENQSPRLNKSEIPLDSFLESLCANWQGPCRNAGKELIIENQLDNHSSFVSDKDLVQQILANLIDNACKYSRSAADPRLWLRVREDSGRLVFEVEDRGPGVDAADRRSIFRPFRQSKAHDGTAGGVGLGLALAQRWAALLGGRLEITSGQNAVGACFRISLPKQQ